MDLITGIKIPVWNWIPLYSNGDIVLNKEYFSCAFSCAKLGTVSGLKNLIDFVSTWWNMNATWPVTLAITWWNKQYILPPYWYLDEGWP